MRGQCEVEDGSLEDASFFRSLDSDGFYFIFASGFLHSRLTLLFDGLLKMRNCVLYLLDELGWTRRWWTSKEHSQQRHRRATRVNDKGK